MFHHMMYTLVSVTLFFIFPTIQVINSLVVPSNRGGRLSLSSNTRPFLPSSLMLIAPTAFDKRTIRWTFSRGLFREPTTMKSIDSKYPVRVTRPASSPFAEAIVPGSSRHNAARHYSSFPFFMAQGTPTDNESNENTESSISVDTSLASSTRTKGMDRVAVVQTGLGCCHGRNVTKAAIRAIRDAIEYNSVKIRTIIPGGYDNLKIHLQLGAPSTISVLKEADNSDDSESAAGMVLDTNSILKEFPYGTVVMPLDIRVGGLLASNGIGLAGAGVPKEDMTLVVACVTVGYDNLPETDIRDGQP